MLCDRIAITLESSDGIQVHYCSRDATNEKAMKMRRRWWIRDDAWSIEQAEEYEQAIEFKQRKRKYPWSLLPARCIPFPKVSL